MNDRPDQRDPRDDTRQLQVAARELIGSAETEDWKFSPTAHATLYQSRAPELSNVLRGSATESIAREFEQFDSESQRCKRKFQRTARNSNRCILATGILSAIVLVVTNLGLNEEVERIALGVLGGLSIVAGALASMWLFRLREGALFDAWQSARAKAESRRLEYFRRLPDLGRQLADSASTALLILEYFRRYQLDVQIAFYASRSRSHGAAADRTLNTQAIAVLLASISSGIAGLSAAAANSPRLAGLAALGVLGAALAAYASTRESVNQDRKNCERYGRTLEALNILQRRLDEVRSAAARGEWEPVTAYIDAVDEQLSLEHREWLDAAESTRTAIGALENALKEHGTR